MAEPIEIAFNALSEAVAAALVASGFLTDPVGLQVDPLSAFEPSPDAVGLEIAAELFRQEVRPVRQLMGGATPRWVVDMPVQLVLSAHGPAPYGDGPKVRLGRALTALAPLGGDDPTLGQTCERLTFAGLADNDLPPNGVAATLSLVIRLRAGDPLGRTAP